MTTTYNCMADDERTAGLAHARRAILEKKCVVFPTDTVYGIAADAFSPQAVTMLLVSKGRGRSMPPPVLIPRLNALDGLATDVFPDARQLAEAFWPGGLTLILHAQPSLDWDLGDTKGTVALRIPADEVAQELLTVTGPLAVSSANRTGQAPAQTAFEARSQLAESVEVYLEGGFRPVAGTDALPSTIVDATSLPLRVVREGAVSLERLREVVPGLLDIDGNAAEPDETAGPEATTEPVNPADPEAAAEPEMLAEPDEAAAVPDADPAELSESGEQEPGEKTPGGPAGEKTPGVE